MNPWSNVCPSSVLGYSTCPKNQSREVTPFGLGWLGLSLVLFGLLDSLTRFVFLWIDWLNFFLSVDLACLVGLLGWLVWLVCLVGSIDFIFLDLVCRLFCLTLTWFVGFFDLFGSLGWITSLVDWLDWMFWLGWMVGSLGWIIWLGWLVGWLSHLVGWLTWLVFFWFG